MVLKQYQKGDYQYTDVDRYPFIDFLRKAYKYGPDAEAMRLWTWQACTEFGLFPTTDSADEIFVHALPLSYFMNLCTNVFQEEFYAARVQAGVEKTNLMYGGRDNYRVYLFLPISDPKENEHGSNVVVTSSLNDPWQPLSKLPTKDRSIVTVTIEGGDHCADMYTDVDVCVREAHRVVGENVRSWLNSCNSY
ncbi:hypothetical protein OESDEN_24647 [Oesophagostomum dentatum]|uniref:Serine carboxypeptidase S28 n=1 Tax=Oesophagostomum dentatum TaxID=61180 RepID=A0A0B1RX10_OESDE|nr:hypothetical protein OESDEN_24647 [Oesophagostomum dentatum]